MILFVCETQAQILNAINIRINLFSKENVDICLCDNNERAEFIAKQIRKSNIFNNAYIYKSVLNTNQSFVSKIKKAISNISLVRKMRKILPNYNKRYQRIFIAGPSLSCIGVYYYFRKCNKNIKLSLYEEGLFEYCELVNIKKIRRLYSKIFYSSYYLDDAEDIYLYEPNLLLDKYKKLDVKKIPKLSLLDHEYKKILNKIFNFSMENINIFNSYKYLFIEQAFSNEREDKIQMDILSNVVDCVSAENLLIKLHPASKVDKYSMFDVNTIKTSESMEMILLNAAKSDITVITVWSSAALNYKLVFGVEPKLILLYKLFDESLSIYVARFFEKFEKIYSKDRIFIPSNFLELENYQW